MKENTREKLKKIPPRLFFALCCYLVLLITGLVLLLPVRSQEERYVLGFFLAVFALLTWKTIIHAKKGS